ncbi:hypothetical protein [Microbacterium sp. KR10-403]|uniref:hypothetical protein n=1 Tax=Microbacterium sp. KR10-403 TaxID=3158581 RepID=UPI0032E37754
MGRLIFGLLGALLVSGLALALLTSFDWDLVALGTWIVEPITDLVTWVADWLLGLPLFQKLVSR